MNELFGRVRALLTPELASRIAWMDDGDDEDGWQVLLILDNDATGEFVGYAYGSGWEKQVFSLGETRWERHTIESLAESVAASYRMLTDPVNGPLPH